MSGRLPDRAHFLTRQENLATVITQIPPVERTAFEAVARPVLDNLAYCDSHDCYVLDCGSLAVHGRVCLFPEEVAALRRLLLKLGEETSL